jgi:hypothetical protein
MRYLIDCCNNISLFSSKIYVNLTECWCILWREHFTFHFAVVKCVTKKAENVIKYKIMNGIKLFAMEVSILIF